MDYESVISHFKVRSRKGDTAKCICPAHADKEASLSVTKGDNGILIHCHAGCDTKDVLAMAGLSISDICNDNNKLSCYAKITWYYATQCEWKDSNGKDHKGYGEGVHIAAEYPYYDEKGVYLYSKLRFEGGAIQGKLIRYYFIDKVNDTATPRKKIDTKKSLYRLPEFLANRKKSQYVYIVEGEKDVETLRKLGCGFGCCVTAGGASDWCQEFARYFKGLNVIIFRDNDNAGFRLSEQIKKDLKPFAYYVKVVSPSTLDHGDVTDYLTKEGGTAQSLKALCDNEADGSFAPWVKTDNKGHVVGINPGILADTIFRYEIFTVQRNVNAMDDKDRLMFYQNGVYIQLNKGGVKAIIKEYLPTARQTDNLLNNVFNLLLATNDNVYPVSAYNADWKYINFLDGLYNIETMQLENHRVDVLSTIQHNFRYSDAIISKPIRFLRYIEELCSKPDGSVDQEQIDIIQEYCGFLISNLPMSKIKAVMILYSPLGNSGKSVFIRLLCKIFGIDRVASIKLSELKPDNRFILGSLPECRLIACGDESNTNVKDSSTFKSLTGGDPVKSEPKSKQGFSYEYRGGFVIACNGLPFFEDDRGDHLFDRLIILPCEHHITEKDKDAKLDEKLFAEIPGIVAWSIDGLNRLMKNKFVFSKSKSVECSKKEYRKHSDNLYRFVTESYTITNDYNDRISKKSFEDAYHSWAVKDSSIKEIDRKNIAARLGALGVTTDTGNIGERRNIAIYRGIKENISDDDFISMDNIDTTDILF